MSKTGNNDMGWWSDSEGEIVDPPYLTPEPGQAGECVCNYRASLQGFASGAYPNGDPVPESKAEPQWDSIHVGGTTA